MLPPELFMNGKNERSLDRKLQDDQIPDMLSHFVFHFPFVSSSSWTGSTKITPKGKLIFLTHGTTSKKHQQPSTWMWWVPTRMSELWTEMHRIRFDSFQLGIWFNRNRWKGSTTWETSQTENFNGLRDNTWFQWKIVKCFGFDFADLEQSANSHNYTAKTYSLFTAEFSSKRSYSISNIACRRLETFTHPKLCGAREWPRKTFSWKWLNSYFRKPVKWDQSRNGNETFEWDSASDRSIKRMWAPIDFSPQSLGRAKVDCANVWISVRAEQSALCYTLLGMDCRDICGGHGFRSEWLIYLRCSDI
jgi:hypothetical protein